jgi:hypothetical protein
MEMPTEERSKIRNRIDSIYKKADSVRAWYYRTRDDVVSVK